MSGGFDQLRPPAMHWSSDSFRQAMPVLWDSSGIDIDGRVRAPCCGTYRRFMFRNVCRTHVLNRLRATCNATGSGPLVIKAHSVGRNLGLCCETCSEPSLAD